MAFLGWRETRGRVFNACGSNPPFTSRARYVIRIGPPAGWTFNLPSLVKYTIASEFRRRPIKTSTAKKKKKKIGEATIWFHQEDKEYKKETGSVTQCQRYVPGVCQRFGNNRPILTHQPPGAPPPLRGPKLTVRPTR